MFTRKQLQTCPRRLAELGPWEHAENLDRWIPSGPAGPICSFCGSLNPEEFLNRVREGWIVGPTDKTYKAYLGRPVTETDTAQSKNAWLDQVALPGTDREALALLWDREHAHPSCGQEAKFYFQHLTPDQGREFVRLYNDHTMRLGYPGRFYTSPYFMVPAPGPAADTTGPAPQ